MHIFVTRFKCLIRDKQLIFWSFLFPIVLATLFRLTFVNISKGEIYTAIDIAVIKSQDYEQNHGFKAAIEQVSTEEAEKLFNVTYTDENNAVELLKNSKVVGYIYLNPEINLVVKSSGIKETVIKIFLDNFKQNESTMTAIIKANPRAAAAEIIMSATGFKEYTKVVSPSSGEPNTNLNYFYSLIAMACLYGGFLGLKEVTDIQADFSKRAARVNMAPVHKMKVFLSGLTAAILIQFLELILLLGYLYFVLQIDFGNQLPYIILLCFVGGTTGISLGSMISAIIKKSEGIKVGILIAVSLAGAALSGMYYANLKYIVEKNVPFLAKINPAALITDGFYTLYYYNSHERFFVNTAILVVLSAVFCTVTYLIIRRQKYASI
jgi:ABC-2 type transport system permease protein